MLSSTVTDETTKALTALIQSNIVWFPCGSRYFGDAGRSSDFDFFTKDHPRVRESLEIAGFTVRDRAIAGRPLDANTFAIYERGNVHAICVKSAALRLAAQTWFRHQPSEDRRSTENWNRFYAGIEPSE